MQMSNETKSTSPRTRRQGANKPTDPSLLRTKSGRRLALEVVEANGHLTAPFHPLPAHATTSAVCVLKLYRRVEVDFAEANGQPIFYLCRNLARHYNFANSCVHTSARVEDDFSVPIGLSRSHLRPACGRCNYELELSQGSRLVCEEASGQSQNPLRPSTPLSAATTSICGPGVERGSKTSLKRAMDGH